MTRRSRTVLYATTAAHLRPAQIAHRARLRTQRAVAARLPESLWSIPRRGVVVVGWPAGYEPMDLRLAPGWPSPEANARGCFRFLEESRELGRPRPDWVQAQASRLWRFHLHYFEWAWSFAACPDRAWARGAFAELWCSWRAGTGVGRGDAWSPYVASMRAWVLCGIFDAIVAGSAIEGDVVSQLHAHGRFVRAHLERDVGGNHLIKNLKALLGLGVFLGEDRLAAVGRRGLGAQLAVQVLDDGGHYERSPSYHCQVLGDLIDVDRLAASAEMPPVPGIGEAIGEMRRWLGAMLLPDGDVPLFNDCTLVGTDRVRALGPARPAPGEPVTVLQPSGYVVVRRGRLHLVADVGPPCPPNLPAHAHADTLSFELAVDGKRLIVDSGTSTYAAGPRRLVERSTAGHNTVEVDGADSTEVWGVFRAARLAAARLEWVRVDGSRSVVTASHDGYRRLRGRPTHRRRWEVGDAIIVVHDDVVGSGTHRAVFRLYATPGVPVVARRDGAATVGPATVRTTADLVLSDAEVASGFGRCAPTTVLSVTWAGMLPFGLQTTFTLDDARSGP